MLKDNKIDPSEDDMQKAIIEWCAFNPPLNKLVIHIPNEGKRTKSYGAKMKSMGLKPGASDLFIMTAKRGYNGAFIELKSKNGRLSKNQKDFLEIANQENYFTAVCWSIEECIEAILWYMGRI